MQVIARKIKAKGSINNVDFFIFFSFSYLGSMIAEAQKQVLFF